MHDTHAILCFGKTLPGHDPLAVRRAIQRTFQCPESVLTEMFSGRQVKLREQLSADEAEQWRQQLHELGLKVMIDPPLSARAQPSAPAACPHRSAEATGDGPPADTDPARPPIFGLGLNGRFGRDAYLAASCVTLVAGGLFLPLRLLLADIAWGLPAAVLALLLLLYPLRAAWLRLHDLGLSGAWALATLLPPGVILAASLPHVREIMAQFPGLGTLVSPLLHLEPLVPYCSRFEPLALGAPYFGILVWLGLLAWPGEQADNRWGTPPERANAIPAVLGAVTVTGAYTAAINIPLKYTLLLLTTGLLGLPR